jgi:hypothetical protein
VNIPKTELLDWRGVGSPTMAPLSQNWPLLLVILSSSPAILISEEVPKGISKGA